MTDYIKRKDAYFISNDMAMMYATDYTKREYGVADRITQEILRLPSADVVEVGKKYWFKDGYEFATGKEGWFEVRRPSEVSKDD